nr:hypothetical protein BaRGS_025815 [Batillaria attramentaria]
MMLAWHEKGGRGAVGVGGSATGTAEKRTVRVTDLLTGQCVRVLERANNAAILCLTMHGSLLLGGDSEGRVYFWNARTGEAEAAVQVHDAAINTITYHNGRFYTGSSDGTMTEYDLMTMTCLRVLRGHKGPLRRRIHPIPILCNVNRT